MTKKTRQQRRARARAPLQRRRRGGRLFLVFLTLVVLGGVGLIVLFNPAPTRSGTPRRVPRYCESSDVTI
jgi:cell division septal protein FtsQ